jgi:hypothetical protein
LKDWKLFLRTLCTAAPMLPLGHFTAAPHGAETLEFQTLSTTGSVRPRWLNRAISLSIGTVTPS